MNFTLNFGSSIVPHVTFFIMATDPVNDHSWVAPQASSTSSSTTLPRHHMEDINSTSYIPRMARMIPTSMTVHTFFVKKISFPMTSRPDELWILERTTDGTETWKPIEAFLENLQISQDPNVLRTAAKHWRQLHAVPLISSSSPSSSHFPVLPHPEHPDVHFDRPVSVIPDHTHTHFAILLGTLRTTSLPGNCYIPFLATMALYTTIFTCWPNLQNYDLIYDSGTYNLYPWTFTT